MEDAQSPFMASQDVQSPFMDSPSPPPPSTPWQRANMSPFYYGLMVIGSAAVVLALYNFIIVMWCSRSGRRRSAPAIEFVSQSFDNSSANLVSTFKYHMETGEQNFDNECAVCLSVFDDDEDVRQLPNCKHSFHAPCIDMWLYSHSDCPLCRAAVGPLVAHCLVHLEDEISRSSGNAQLKVLCSILPCCSSAVTGCSKTKYLNTSVDYCWEIRFYP